MSFTVDTADDVVALLNASAIATTYGFTAVRKYQAVYDLEDLDELTVTVIPASEERTIETRNNVGVMGGVSVHIDKKLTDADDESEIDTLMDLVEDICAELELKTLYTTDGYSSNSAWVQTIREALYSMESLNETRHFNAVVTFVFRRQS